MLTLGSLTVPISKYETKWSTVNIGALVLHILELQDFERTVDRLIDLLHAEGKRDIVPEDCPYFGQIWAASRALATELEKRDLKDKKILEVGCGLALPSLTAALKGAYCQAFDLHKDVKYFLDQIIVRNKIDQKYFTYTESSWKTWPSTSQEFDLIIGSDILYENQHPGELVTFLDSQLKKNGLALISDPCRWHHQHFIQSLKDAGMTVSFRYDWTQEDDKPVKICMIEAKKI